MPAAQKDFMNGHLLQIVPPAQEAFESGKLLLPQNVASEAGTAVAWSDVLVNSTLVVVFALLVLLNMRTYIHIIPQLVPTLTRWKVCLSLDHNIHLCRERNLAALFLIVPFCLLEDRFGLLHPSIIETLPAGWQVPAVTGFFLAYLILRRIFYALCSFRTRRRETFLAAHRSSYGYFVLMMLLLLASVGICYVFRCNELIFSWVLLIEILFCYLVSVVRKGQILNSFCNPFVTFLYLCGLELIPTGLLAAAVVLL